MTETVKNKSAVDAMFKAGAHFGYTRSRRHPTVKPYIWGAKNRIEIFNLEATQESLEKAKKFVKGVAQAGKTILFVGGKKEAQDSVRAGAESIEMPNVPGRWIGGTLTNFGHIRKQVTIYEDLIAKREKGEFGKYTKKERLLLDRKIEKMEKKFLGLLPMKDLPGAVFVVDSEREHIAVSEARIGGIPVVSLSGSDCNLKDVDYAIPGNDSSLSSITFFVNEIVSAYTEGKSVKV
ncbi:MAG: 30S ribosomal protein S2 [Patescibacteria group bacterium]